MRGKGNRELTLWFTNVEDGCDPSHDDCPNRSISYFRTRLSTPPLYRFGHTVHAENVSNIPEDVRVFCTKGYFKDVCLCLGSQSVVVVCKQKHRTFAPRKVCTGSLISSCHKSHINSLLSKQSVTQFHKYI